MNECIAEQGLGFLMLGGRAVMDEDRLILRLALDFKGKVPKPSNTGRSTRRKASFEPLHIEALWFSNTAALEAAKAAGVVSDFKQGRQPSGESPKREVRNFNVAKARLTGPCCGAIRLVTRSDKPSATTLANTSAGAFRAGHPQGNLRADHSKLELDVDDSDPVNEYQPPNSARIAAAASSMISRIAVSAAAGSP